MWLHLGIVLSSSISGWKMAGRLELQVPYSMRNMMMDGELRYSKVSESRDTMQGAWRLYKLMTIFISPEGKSQSNPEDVAYLGSSRRLRT